MDIIPNNLKDLTNSANDDFHEPFDFEENVNPQLNYQCSAQESALIPNNPSVEEINITPGEWNKPNLLLTDENSEAAAFPCLSPTGKYGYTVKWDIKIMSSEVL